MIPDHLPERLRQLIASWLDRCNSKSASRVSTRSSSSALSRRQDNARSETNLRWLLECSQAHVHADLIFGLPGETLASFAEGFDRLYRLRPHEIQLGLLCAFAARRSTGTPPSTAWCMTNCRPHGAATTAVDVR